MKQFSSLRKEVKAEAKAQIKRHWAGCIGGNLICFCMVAAVCYMPFFVLLIIIAQQNAVAAIGQQAASVQMGTNALGAVITALILILLATAPLCIGLMNLYISVGRGQYEGLGAMLRPYGRWKTFWRSIRFFLCLLFRVLCWFLLIVLAVTLIPMLVYAPSMGIDGFTRYMEIYGALPHAWIWSLLYFLLTLLAGAKTTTYFGALVLMHDDETIGAWRATTCSAQRFKGMFWNILIFNLSFLPWYLLVFVLFLVVLPLCGLLAAFNTFLAFLLAIFLMLAAVIGMAGLMGFVYSYPAASLFRLFDLIAPSSEVSQERAFDENVQPVLPNQLNIYASKED